VVKGCKVIADILPFDRKNHVLLDEPDLMKFMMLALPLNPISLNLLIKAMIDKFRRI
jgi:hypothetical protein